MRKIIIISVIIMLSGCSNEEVGKVVCKEFPKEVKQSDAIEDVKIQEPNKEIEDKSDEDELKQTEISEPTNEVDSNASDEEPIAEPTPQPKPNPEPTPKPKPEPESEPVPEPEPENSIVIEAIEQDFEGEDGDFIADDGSLNYFYKKYESFEACQAAGDEILWDWDSDWGSYSCLGYSLYYTK